MVWDAYGNLIAKTAPPVIQRILRHSTVATTQNHYIKTSSPDAVRSDEAVLGRLIVLSLCSRSTNKELPSHSVNRLSSSASSEYGGGRSLAANYSLENSLLTGKDTGICAISGLNIAVLLRNVQPLEKRNLAAGIVSWCPPSVAESAPLRPSTNICP
jgi:hypothetical protein